MPLNRMSWIELVQHLRARWDFHSARAVLEQLLQSRGMRVQALYTVAEIERVADALAEHAPKDEQAQGVVAALRSEVRRLSAAA